MWYYAALFLAIVGIAEMLGLGGVPARPLEAANILFGMLLLGLIAAEFSRFFRR